MSTNSRRFSDRSVSYSSVSGVLSDVSTDFSEHGGDQTSEGRRRRRQHRKTSARSPSLVCQSMARRLSLQGSSLPVAVEYSAENSGDSRGVDGRPNGHHLVETVDDNQQTTELPPATGGEAALNFRSMDRVKRLTFVNFCMTNLCVGCFYSMLGPFFPTEAAKKGVSSTIVGLIFGIFELTIVLTSPIIGNFLTRIGAKFLYVTGVFVCGSAAALFGLLDGSPDGTIYIVMCFLVRIVEALGAAALTTASFATIANTFPDSVASMFGALELFTGLGLMIGPPVGGALFQLGGFKLPFFSLGFIMVLVSILTIFILPSPRIVRLKSEGTVLSLFRMPVITVMGLCLMSGSGCIGFIDVTLSVFLNAEYGLTPVILGLVFLVGPGVYALTAPIWGRVVDKTPRYNKIIIICGYLITGTGFYFMGPAPFIPIPHMLWLTIVSLSMMGLGVGTLVITFQVITEATLAAGYPDDLSTHGLIAGVFNSFFSFGAFIGPFGGGYLNDLLGFEMAAVIVGSVSWFAAAVLGAFVLITHIRQRDLPDKDATSSDIAIVDSSERQPLLSNGKVARQYSSQPPIANGHAAAAAAVADQSAV